MFWMGEIRSKVSLFGFGLKDTLCSLLKFVGSVWARMILWVFSNGYSSKIVGQVENCSKISLHLLFQWGVLDSQTRGVMTAL